MAQGRLPGGTGRCSRDVLEDEALDGPVVEIEVGELGLAEVGLPADRFIPIDLPGAIRPLDREAVILGGDVDPARLEVLDRVIRAAVAEGSLKVSSPTARQSS